MSGSVDKTIRIWSIETGSCFQKLDDYVKWVWCVRFNAKRIISGSLDGTIKIWDLPNSLDPNYEGELCIRTIDDHIGGVTCLQFDDSQIISGSISNTILICNF